MKTQLVILNEHTLGFITPEQPDLVQHLRASVMRGAIFSLTKESDVIGYGDKIRLASEKDFKDYNCVFDGFKQDVENYEYAK